MTYIGKLLEEWGAEQLSVKKNFKKKPAVLKQYSGDIDVSKGKMNKIKNNTTPGMG